MKPGPNLIKTVSGIIPGPAEIGGIKPGPNVIKWCWRHQVQAQRDKVNGQWDKTQSCHPIGQEIKRDCQERGDRRVRSVRWDFNRKLIVILIWFDFFYWSFFKNNLPQFWSIIVPPIFQFALRHGCFSLILWFTSSLVRTLQFLGDIPQSYKICPSVLLLDHWTYKKIEIIVMIDNATTIRSILLSRNV